MKRQPFRIIQIVLLSLLLATCGSSAPDDLSDPEITIAQLEEFADQGNLEAMHQLGRAYGGGERGVEVDNDKALEWYMQAAEQGYAKSQHNLGGLHYSGLGVKQSYETANEWFTKAADQGLANSQHALGIAYEYGLGTERNRDMADDYYQKAAKQEFQMAKDALERLKREDKLLGVFAEMFEIRSAKDAPSASKELSFKGEPIIGVADAPMTVVAYLSPECRYCTNFITRIYARLMTNYVEPGNVNIVIRFLPLSSLTDFYGALTADCMADHGSTVGEFWMSLVDNWGSIQSGRNLGLVTYPAKARFESLADYFSKINASKECWTEKRANELLQNRQDLAAFYKGIGYQGSIGVPVLFADVTRGKQVITQDALVLRGASPKPTAEEEQFFRTLDAAIEINRANGN